MKPSEFKQQNILLVKPESMTDEECSSLPAFKYPGGIISCWKMSFWERLKVLFSGIVWVDIVGYTQPPIWLDVENPWKEPRE